VRLTGFFFRARSPRIRSAMPPAGNCARSGKLPRFRATPTDCGPSASAGAFERGPRAGACWKPRAPAQQVRAGHLETHRAGWIANLQAGLDELASSGADALLDLALEVARQVLRREPSLRRDGRAARRARGARVDCRSRGASPRAPEPTGITSWCAPNWRPMPAIWGCSFVADFERAAGRLPDRDAEWRNRRDPWPRAGAV